jgi:hypothetical protein
VDQTRYQHELAAVTVWPKPPPSALPASEVANPAQINNLLKVIVQLREKNLFFKIKSLRLLS